MSEHSWVDIFSHHLFCKHYDEEILAKSILHYFLKNNPDAFEEIMKNYEANINLETEKILKSAIKDLKS